MKGGKMRDFMKAAFLTFIFAFPLSLTGAEKFEPDAEWVYKEIDGKKLKASVFLPDDYDESKSFPTIVIFHGGSWRTGEANWHFPDCAYWSDRGMIAMSVDYRLKDRDNVEVPLECVKDAKTTVRFLRTNAAKLKIDREKIVVAGGSAGGQLAAATAMITGASSNDQSHDLSISCKPDAVILYNPYFKCAAELSPPEHVVKGLPPTIAFLGDQDPAIPVADLKAFHENMKKEGNVSALYIGKGGKHGFCNGRNPRNPFFYWSLELADQFLVEQGILEGSPLVKRPEGVAVIQDDGFNVYK